MVKGGADNRSFRLQRRKKRPKKFHEEGQLDSLCMVKQMKLVNFLVQVSIQWFQKHLKLVAFPLDNDIINDFTILKTLLLLIIQRLQLHKEKLTLFYLGHPPTNCQAIV